MKQMRILEQPRLLGIVWPFFAVVLLQALLGSVSLYTLSAVRSYVAGESLWSKGQKDAIYYLNLYALSRDEADYRNYLKAIAIPQGDHALRIALDEGEPDLPRARAGALQGGNHPDDISGIIWLYLHFRHFGYLERAVEHWRLGDLYLAELDQLAWQMHERIKERVFTDADAVRWRQQIRAINEGVAPAAAAFSNSLGEGSRVVGRILIGVNLVTAFSLILLALLRTRKLLQQRHAFASALQVEKDRAQVTLASIGDGVITVDEDGTITYMNPAAESLTHWRNERAVGLPLAALFSLLDGQGQQDGSVLIEHIVSGRLSGSSGHSRMIQRLDGSTVTVALSGSPIHSSGDLDGAVLVLHDMTQERQFIADLSWQATHDALTGLANRREFESRLETVLARKTDSAKRCSLMFLDLDQFKLVNDTSGHAAGDELLRHICALLQQGMREGDTLARLGGDEFGILLEPCTPELAEKVAENLRRTVQNLHFVWRGRPFVTTISIGMVHIDHTLVTLESVLRAADMACYMAKEKGRNRVQVYHEDDSELSTRVGEMAWIQRLHVALDEQRFCLYSQEIAALGSQEDAPGHLEILLRLRDESGRLILPNQFIPAAERYGMMTLLDRWVVERVFQVISDCLRAAHDHGRMPVCAINLSGASIGDEDFLAFLRQQFRAYSIPPELICFEITETCAIANLGSAIRFINELKAIGCRFSLDDFCAGMSSFAYLKHLPVDFLKIDGSFVRDMLEDPVNRAMVEVINHIGHVMGKQTIAEFVESPQIEQALMEIGVDYAQGYVIERPRLFTCECLHSRPTRQAYRHSAHPGVCAELLSATHYKEPHSD